MALIVLFLLIIAIINMVIALSITLLPNGFLGLAVPIGCTAGALVLLAVLVTFKP